MKSQRLTFVSCVIVAAFVCGCVRPGRLDPSMVARYQREMARRGPQVRAGEAGLDLLRPSMGGPALKMTRDPKTKTAVVHLSLDEAIMLALANSVDIRVVSFDPAISRQQVIEAAAEFDYVVFGGYAYSRTDERTAVAYSASKTDVHTFEAGLRQKAVTGADWSATWNLTRTEDNSAFSTARKRYEPTIALELTQPLLRNAWPDFNLANFRIARIGYETSLSVFRQNVEQIVTNVIVTYWNVVRAQQELEIQRRLLEATVKTFDKVSKRAKVDATDVQIKQAEAAVESRRAALIRAGKIILDFQDQLARLLADKQINVLAEYRIRPSSAPVTTLVRLDASDQLATALKHNALMEQARLGITGARITVRVAANQTLPKADLSGSVTWQGLGDAAHEGHEKLFTGDYLSYGVSVTVEYPLGNRAAIAGLRRSRLELRKAVANLQNIADQVAVLIRERIRQARTAFREIDAQRAALKASRAELRALEAIEEIHGRLTPEFLQVKLRAQESVANAERAELQAIVDYNTALAELAQATGTVMQMHRVKIAIQPVTGRPAPAADRPRPALRKSKPARGTAPKR